MLFNMVHTTSNIIFKLFGTTNHHLCPFFYLDKSRSYDVIIPNIYWNILSKMPTGMINIHTKYEVDSCNGRVFFMPQKKKCLLRLQAFLSRCRVLHDWGQDFSSSQVFLTISSIFPDRVTQSSPNLAEC